MIKHIVSVLLYLMIVFLVVFISIATLAGSDPDTVNVNSEDAFVYPSGDQMLLVLETGEYAVSGERIGGCYRLTEGDPGRAEYVWPVCVKGK